MGVQFEAAEGGQAHPVFDWAGMAAKADRARWTPAEAFFAVLIAAATCDGRLDRHEHETMLALVHRCRLVRAMREEDITKLNASVVQKFRDAPDTALNEACSALPYEIRLPTFAQAMDIILADGNLSQPEAALLNALVAHLELATQDVQRVAEVIMLKNRV